MYSRPAARLLSEITLPRSSSVVLARVVLAGAVLAFAILGSGCGGNESPPSGGAASSRNAAPPVQKAAGSSSPGGAATTAPGTAPGSSPANSSAAAHANELGRVMVLEYHQIVAKTGDYYQSPAQLRSDLQALYDHGYVTLDIHDYLNGNITTPAGKSPVVLTFDDASPSQFRYLVQGGKTTIDPDCAVGILNAFSDAHPDFGHHATFFVLASSEGGGFGQKQYTADKYKYLVTHGYAIGNHTWTHPIMTHKTPAQVQEELGRDEADIRSILPDYTVDIIAYPFGTRPKVNGKPDYTYIANGVWQGQHYHMRAGFLVGAEPAPSPFSKKLKPYAIPRVQALQPQAKGQHLDFWLKQFDGHPLDRFVSDGDPSVVTIPHALAANLNRQAVGSRKVVETNG